MQRNSLWRLPLSLLGTTSLAFVLMAGSCPGPAPQPPVDAGAYHTYEETQSELQNLAAQYPNMTAMTSIGKSVEGRDLWALRISAQNSDADAKPAVLLVGGHHAREWISVDVPLMLADYLLANAQSDTLVHTILAAGTIWIVPMVNPDGHHYSVASDRLWRKNRRNNGDGTYGVDLNRNYSYHWGGSGSSGDTFSEIYRGPSAFSEPESRAVRDLIAQHDFRALITYHSFSQLILYPWGYTYDAAPDASLMRNLTISMSDRIRAVHGKNYVAEQSSDLYLSSGDTTDWLYGEKKVPSFTIELRPTNDPPGFVLPESEIVPTFEENLPAATYLLQYALLQPVSMSVAR